MPTISMFYGILIQMFRDELHQAELLADWALCQANQHPNPIDPLR
jgi:hypothetical protein